MRHTLPSAAILALCLSSACARGSNAQRSESPLAPSGTNLSVSGTCQTITNNAGTLALKQDLSGADPSCLKVTGGSGELDCLGHDIQGLELTDVHGFTIRNCRMRSFNAMRSTDVTVTSNVITADTHKTVAGVVRFADGGNNRIVSNTIDGGWAGQPYPLGGFPPGADDGILIDNTGSLLIEGNSIRNVWDCGIERLGNRTDAVTIRNNDIANAGECGIGGWFAAGWQDSLITDNTVSSSEKFGDFYYSPQQNRGVDHITFRNNVFENNRFINTLNRAMPSVTIDYVTATSRFPIDIGNNIFRNNDFGGDILAPRLAPPFGFVDGGDNICHQDGKSSLTCVR
ncbi:MAG TPA: right-handed parallel beta-helix repeat-containing protein [Vicinamibacterales bacterium]